MTPIAAQVNSNAVSSGLLTEHRRGDDTRLGRASRLPDRGDVIDVYVKSCSHCFFLVSGLWLLVFELNTWYFDLGALNFALGTSKYEVQSSKFKVQRPKFKDPRPKTIWFTSECRAPP